MLLKWQVPKTIQWVVKLFCIFLLVFTLFRISTYLIFKPKDISFASVLPAFQMGIRFDIRWICIVLLPIVLCSSIPSFAPFASEKAKRVWVIYLAIITFLMMFFFGADYGHFAYVNTRLNASALNFKEDPKISFEMLWQSYPVVWMILALVAMGYLFYWLYKKTHQKIVVVNNATDIIYKKRWSFITTAFMLLGIYGSLGFKPLKHEDAFVFRNNFKTYLALNPLQNFFTTLGWRKPVFNDEQMQKAYPLMRDFLQLDAKNTNAGSFERTIYPNSHTLESKPNIILVICESFSMYKSSMSGNPLNTTPYFNQLTQQGIFFNRCFTPHFATARGLFATITGIPDVQLSKFSTRNEESLLQQTIINSFEEYNKFYFIGGSSAFNNYRGLINNIAGVHMYEEGMYTSPKLNVWGISDKDLFTESNKILATQQKPFFAIIQTADNHRPYTIPATDKDFVQQQYPLDTLKKYGFLSNEELNAFAYTDYAFKHLIETAKKEKYFDNTIFVFVGDHGVEGNAKAMYPNVWTDNRLSDEHVPFLLYAPKLLSAQLHTEVVSQIDVLPTIAGLLHQHYTNTTLGRDALNPNKKYHGAFIINHDEGKIGWVSDSFYFIKNIRFDQEELLPLNSNTPTWTATQEAAIKKQISPFTSAFYETAKWMLLHNKPK